MDLENCFLATKLIKQGYYNQAVNVFFFFFNQFNILLKGNMYAHINIYIISSLSDRRVLFI